MTLAYHPSPNHLNGCLRTIVVLLAAQVKNIQLDANCPQTKLGTAGARCAIRIGVSDAYKRAAGQVGSRRDRGAVASNPWK